ncbi:MAG: peptidase M28, partial [Pirellulales bacterium]
MATIFPSWPIPFPIPASPASSPVDRSARWTWLVSTAALLMFAATAVDAADQRRPRPETETENGADADPVREGTLLTHIRQLTFEGRRSGEAYFGAKGRQLVFQSEREPGNPFFQIYRMDLESGDIERISPGIGKTTCAWIHPDGRRVLFASTHKDPQSREKQREELELRASGHQRRYAWDYDSAYEIYTYRPGEPPVYQNLTRTEGYDAEGAWSPDGKSIVFASNRRAYDGSMSDQERELFQRDPASAIDLYMMDTDGTHLRRLTTAVGYDGGPFFSPDGRRICWRHFSEEGAIAEIMTMRGDGSDPRQLTRLGAMSWAPFYHPS